jgi:hypothetical protein
MEILKIENIVILTVFFVPGFIYLKAYRLFIAETNTDFSKDLYEAIGFSFLNAIVFAYPIFLIHKIKLIENHSLLYFLILLLIVILAPLIVAYIFSIISRKKWFGKFMINPTKSAWDSFFSKRESYYVIVTLKNGKKIGGKYGINSFSSTFPNPKEIYLEEQWQLNENNGFDKKEPQTEGILITENEISTIEFYI